MAQLINNYLDKIDVLEDEISKNSENILDAINIDELLKDPEGYLLALGDTFLKEHLDEIEKANKEGKKFADTILKKL